MRVLVLFAILLVPSAEALLPIAFEAYEGDVTVTSGGCREHVPARLDILFDVPTMGVTEPAAWLSFESACSEEVLLRTEDGGGGYTFATLDGEYAGFLGPNAWFPGGNGSYVLWLDLVPPLGPRVHVFGDYLLPAEPFSEPIPDWWR